MRKQSGTTLLLLLLAAITVEGQRAQDNSRTWTRDSPSAPQTTNVWSQSGPQTRSGERVNPGVSSDTIDELIVRPGDPASLPVAVHSHPVPTVTSNIDSRVSMLESSVKGVERTLESLLDWLCQLPNENNARTAAGSLACNSRKKTAVVEEPSVIGSSAVKLDRARTRGQSATNDGWSTVGAKPATRGSSGTPTVNRAPITVAELQTFTEELLQKDTNNVASQLTINRQGTTNSRSVDDKAPQPLVTIPSSALSVPTIVAFRALLDNYNPDVKVKEAENNAEVREQNNFLAEIMKTQVMQHTENFLTSRGKIRRPLKDVLKEIWFTMYTRAGRNEGSSGFEHSFVGELKDGKVSGFHNWIQFGHEEKDGDLDYKGFMQYVNLGNKGQIIKGRFTWLNDLKPVGSLFVGTSPEIEMALYTVCFLIKPDQQCQVKLNKKKVKIQTWTHNYKGKKLIGSAYPDI